MILFMKKVLLQKKWGGHGPPGIAGHADILMCPFLFCIWNEFKTKSCCKEGCQTTQLLRTGSYVIIVRAQFPYYSQSEGWAHLTYQSLEHVVRVCEKEPNF